MKIVKGNIFTSSCQTIVNSINCVGVMGAGIALEYKLRYPKMFEKYVELCNKRLIKIGSLWLYKHSEIKWILNFPTKKHWKYPSKTEYLEKGLQKFLDTYKTKGITSIAFPLLGADKGGLDSNNSLDIMKQHLEKCDIDIEIYEYDPFAEDDLYAKFKNIFLSTNNELIASNTQLKKIYIEKIKRSLENPEIRSISRLTTEKGLGIKSIEKVFRYLLNDITKRTNINLELNLF